MNLNIWQLRQENKMLKEKLNKKHGLKGTELQVLSVRGGILDYGSFKDMFFKKGIGDYGGFEDLKKAAKRLDIAIKNKEKIAVFADYDCDGVCSAAVFYRYFTSKNANFVVHVPERDEGYGLNFKVLDEFKKDGVKIVVTVDCGIVSFEEAEYSNKLGIDVIITDHHKTLDVLPKAFAVVNPKREDWNINFKDISGAVVLFKLIAEIDKKSCEELLKDYADLLAISTIADVMPLIYENKIIVKKGLEVLLNTKSKGLKHILNFSLKNNSSKITAVDVAFLICPKLNSAGRLNSAKTAFRLLVEEDEKKALKLAEKVLDYDVRRKKLENLMFQEAVLEIVNECENSEMDVLIVAKEDWPVGLTGLVAAKILSMFKKPAFVFSKQGETLIGSARSFEGFSVYEALKSSSELLIKWGGHNLAGGLSLNFENFKEFKRKVFNFAKKNKPKLYKMKIDCEINPYDVDVKTIKSLEKIGPFGHGNPEPVFLIRKAVLKRVNSVGQDKHLKLGFAVKDFYFEVMFFNKKPCSFYFKVGEVFNILVNLSVNCFREIESVCFKIVDLRPYDLKQKETVLEFYEFNKNMAEKEYIKPIKISNYLYVYKIFKNLKIFYGNEYDLFLVIFRNISFYNLLVVLKQFLYNKILEKTEECLVYKEQNEKRLKDMLRIIKKEM